MTVAFRQLVLLRLFVASYSPLAIIVAVQNSADVWPWRAHLAFWIPALSGVVGLVEAVRLPRGALRRNAIKVDVSGIAEESSQVAAYIATYLLPFLGVGLATWRDWVAIALYLAVLLVVFVQSDLALVNPALYLVRWRVVSAHVNGNRALMLVPSAFDVVDGRWPVVAFGRFYVYKEDR